MRFVVPQCFAAPQNFKRIVGLRLGLLGLYRGAALIATDVFQRIPMVRMIVVVACSLAVYPLVQLHRTCGSATPNMSSFAEAYNRMDADAMTAKFAEDGIR